MINKKFAVIGLVLLWVMVACSTEKNTLLSRTYHGTTAHYNGYFNATDLLKEAVGTYRAGLKEDFYRPLPLRPLPDAEAVKTMYTPIDTAIAKSTKVIQRHAMPGMDHPAAKKEEHNRWIDENWMTIGIANYYRRDYPLAMKNFEYVKKFFAEDKSTYIAEMWIARVNIEEGHYSEATLNIASLDKAAEETAAKKKEKKENSKSKTKSKSKKKKKKKKKKDDDEKEVPDFPKKLRFDLEITRALLAEKKGNGEDMIKALDKSLEYAKKSSDKARIHFILGQLNEAKGDRALATMHYAKVLKYNGSYEMNFNARLKKALNSGTAKVKQDLNKMLRDPKNAEFKDQIYYTLGLISQQESNDVLAIDQFTDAAFYSTTNAQQKGMAYERLGDIFFRKKEYISAQKYYDSCTVAAPPTYPNLDAVKLKASKLKDLVTATEIAFYEDSVQRISGMSDSERYAFAEKVIKKIKADDEKRKRQEAEKAQQLQASASKADPGSGGKWYWNNPKVVKEGFEDFKRQWGTRENQDDWRRSDKVTFASFAQDTTGKSAAKAPVAVETDTLTPELLLAKLPKGDSSLRSSQKRMMEAYFAAGRIYEDQLNEKGLAEQQYRIILGKPFESEYKLLASYQIYRMYDPTDPKAYAQKEFILTNYPTSDFAGYLRDPDYFLKKKERDKETEQEYMTDLERYDRGLYYPVLTKANQVIYQDKANQYRSKYYLLKVKVQAKLNEDKTTLLPTIDSLMLEYPGTPEAKKAAEMKEIITKGYSKNDTASFAKKASIYSYSEDVPMQVLIFMGKNVTVNVGKTRVADFNKEFFGRNKLNTSSKLLGNESVVLVKEFENEDEAAGYVSTFKNTKKHLLDLQKAKIFYISLENLKILFESLKLEEYELFFDEYY